jgi:amino acid adenylation domain-containing protein
MSESRESPLPELEIQYADYAAWQREYLTGRVLEREVGYWKEHLKEMAVVGLPTDYSRPAAPSHRGSRERVVIEQKVSEDLKRLSQREGATLFMALMAAFKVVLMRYSGEEDVSVGTPTANRTRREVEGLIGFFVNTLVMRTALGGNPSFRELIEREREVALGAYAHQEAPFEKLVEEINPDRDLSRSPLFQVMMMLQNAWRPELEIKGLKVRGVGRETGAAKFDLTLILAEGDGGITGSLEYSRDLYEGETIRRMARHYERVIWEVVRDAEQKIREIELLNEGEKSQIIEWNQTELEYECDRCINQLFEDQVEISPESIAVVYEGEQISYRELNRRANQLGQYLRTMGVGPEVMVGVCLERSIELVVAFMGVLKAGGTYVPLDPSHPEQRLRLLVEDAGVNVVLTGEREREKFQAHDMRIVDLNERRLEIEKCRSGNPESGVGSDNLAYVIYTSGSTGRPKGVMVAHKNLVSLLMVGQERFRFAAEDEMLCLANFSFDISLFELLNPLIVGGKVNLLSRERILDVSQLLVGMRDVNTIHTVPTLMKQIIESIKHDAGSGRSYANIRKVFIGGELVPSALLREMGAVFKESRAEVLYGPTEGTIICTSYIVEPDEVTERNIIGTTLHNAAVYVCDGNGQLIPVGLRGELCIGGEGVARGYLNRPELTAEKYIPSQYGQEAGARVYRTGDLGRYLVDGKLEFLGRTDDQIKLRGYRIELREIEEVLNEHRSVKQSVVIVSEDEREDKRLIGYVVGEDVSAAELKRHLRERLPEYMAPEAILVLEEMPITTNGKLDRKRLPPIKGAGRRPEQEYIAPRTPVEEILAGICEEVLNLDRVGIADNFFELGGHSLLAMQVILRISKALGVEMGVRSVFEEATIEGLASRVEEAMKAERKELAPLLFKVSSEGKLPLSFAQQRLWFIEQLDPGNAIYNIPGAVRLEGSLDIGALEETINEIVRRHEVLRTRIEAEAGEPVQVIDEWGPRKLECADLTSLSREKRTEEIGRIMQEEAQTGFDLKRGPLLRVKVLKLEAEQHILLFTMHHIVSDGWSMGILMREVCEIYAAAREGKGSPLPELEIQYADYASWQRQSLRGERLDEHLRFWRKQLGGELPVLELTINGSRREAQTMRAARESMTFSPELTREIKTLGRREGVTLFMTLLAAFKVLLYRYSGQEDIIVGTAIANRNSVELEKLIGFFINTLPLRVNLSGNPTFRELLARVRETALGAYAHQDLPFEKLVSELQPERSLHQMPLFQVFFALQNAPTTAVRLPGVTVIPMAIEANMAKMDLIMVIGETGQTMTANLEYNSDLFEAGAMKRMLAHFRNLLESIVEGPDQPLSSLRLLTEVESGGQGPSDFPVFQLSQSDFENILMEIDSESNIETI